MNEHLNDPLPPHWRGPFAMGAAAGFGIASTIFGVLVWGWFA